jgi:hypothetical protein|tara:strand:+ start:2088 stop:2555 length:468 start_codon:yes stop_codon:yes gene_type:complete
MSTVIDSKITQLEPAQIITEFAGNYNSTEYPTEVVLASIMKEITMPDTDLVQFGNTAFIGHRGKGKDKHKMVGRGLTVDTAQNFISAGLKYFTYMQEKGITNYITQYDGPIYDKAFEVWKRYVDKGDSKLAVGRLADGNSQAYIFLGKTPLSEIM